MYAKGNFTNRWGLDEFLNNYWKNWIVLWGENIKLELCFTCIPDGFIIEICVKKKKIKGRIKTK